MSATGITTGYGAMRMTADQPLKNAPRGWPIDYPGGVRWCLHR
ncbi:hypothetical protein HMPREF1549_01949 [Actinomyces johnsonii F0510]|uniref:Uncharacterized protein n=1 Tax=Actinomyces johnsonii F0510 TaxID=1227262 RepID=U1PPY1_9ACTO|nr:hypothetical protein HMPREF1549_01949 [Actinomyces johnsonii F0510]